MSNKKITINFVENGGVGINFTGEITFSDLLYAAKHLNVFVSVRMEKTLKDEMAREVSCNAD